MDISGYEKNLKKGQVFRVKKALYGPKQSPRLLFGRLTKVMQSVGYKQSKGDHTLFVKHSKSGLVSILPV